ncbi:MAG TPA: CAP domain-containing protein [Bacteroidales bacterium]|nr:CAP domain-containing protein [Bacteroidales bacterium]
MTIIQLIFLLLLIPFFSEPKAVPATTDSIEIPADVCLNPAEFALFNQLNDYRQANALPPIALSRSLTLVAQVHCRDLAINRPHQRDSCNMHSWSRNNNWSACCYTGDHKRAACMWSKPRELSNYQGDGFEIAFHTTAPFINAGKLAAEAMDSWKKSKGHNDVMVNRGTWKNIKWEAVGVGYYGGYATIWFGMEPDPDSTEVTVCQQ